MPGLTRGNCVVGGSLLLLWGFLLDSEAPVTLRFPKRMLLDLSSWALASFSWIFPGRLW